MSGACAHCAEPIPPGRTDGFCCPGCAGAHAIIHDLGLERWYERRVLQAGVRPPKPEDDETAVDPEAFVRADGEGVCSLHLMVEGLHCAACVWLIESVLAREPGVLSARVNMTTHRLKLRWRPGETDPARLIGAVSKLGYRLLPYDPERLESGSREAERALLRAMAVAGFGAANVMLLSISVWAGAFSDMGPATRDFMHWVSALIALPVVAYSGRPFFGSALTALRAGRLNMDVPISVAVLLAVAMSLYETMRGGPYAYFDAAATLLFFLLVGRYLDRRARSKARSAAERLLSLAATAATVVEPDGRRRSVRVDELRPGMIVAVATGDRVPVDGVIVEGASDLDMSLVTGESVPISATAGEGVFAGTLNLTGPLRIRVSAAGEDTLLAEIVELVETAERGRARYVAIADRVARIYAPAVHVLGLATFVAWWATGAAWQTALLHAVAVLIVTCPCALGLAVPAVQAVAGGRLLRAGVLVKTADALERLNQADMVVFDKTGTLTRGRPELIDGDRNDVADLRLAASLAAESRHPLARALCRAAPPVAALPAVREVPGEGLAASGEGGEIRLGRREWCGVPAEAAPALASTAAPDQVGPELWLSAPGRPPVRFAFTDPPRPAAAEVVGELERRGLGVALMSGDRRDVVVAVAGRLGIDDWRADMRPADKTRRLTDLAGAGRRVLMVGDGLNDAPALAAAFVSMSPAVAADISQAAADLVFQGESLEPIVEAIDVARAADRLVRQNLALAFLYNAVAVPLAVAGLVTPLIAAVAMSTSSLAVTLNALRLRRNA